MLTRIWLLFIVCVLAAADCSAQASPPQPLVSQLGSELYLTVAQSRLALGALLSLAQNRLLDEDFNTLEKAIPNTQELIDLARREGVVNHPLDNIGDLMEVLAKLGLNEQAATAVAPEVHRWLVDAGQGAAGDLLYQALD